MERIHMISCNFNDKEPLNILAKSWHKVFFTGFWMHFSFVTDKLLKVRTSWLVFQTQGTLLVQSQRKKHPNNVWNLFKVNNRDTWTTSDIILVFLLLTLICFEFWFTHCFGVSTVDFKQVNAAWKVIYLP